MNSSRFDKKKSKAGKNKRHFSKLTSLIILGTVIVALVGIGAIIFSKSFENFGVSAQSRKASQDGKMYRATKNIIVDRETGQIRKPNAEEIEELIDNLKTLTNRDENLPSQAASNGAVSLDLDGGYGGTILAKPNPDGTMETRCVFTFQEAIEFLGLVEENS